MKTDTNTVTETATNVATTEQVATTQVKTKATKSKATGAKLGRKPTAVNEITGKDFIIADLEAANTAVKAPTLRAFVARKVDAGEYTIVGTQKSGGRGKPANIYRKA
jgi:hypothetical protein